MARKKDDSKTLHVYNALQAKIIDGKYPGGTFLVEANICEELGVSRTPVREALIRLSNERFIELVPNRGAFVPHISLVDIIELYQLRIANDGMAALLCVKNQPIGVLEKLEASVAKEEALLTEEEPEARQISEEDFVFHNTIIDNCGNTRLISTIKQAENQMKRIVHLSADKYALNALRTSLSFHKKIVQAFKDYSPQDARDLMENHWQEALNGYIQRDIAGTLPRAL